VRDHYVSCGNWSPKNYDGGSGGGGSMPAGVAFAKSLNTVAVDLSLKYERDRVVEMTRRLGVEGVKKTCSMALGDTGITPLQHTAAYATFANDGILAKPYAILDMYSSRGELIYTRDKDEQPQPRVLSRRVVEQMNQMMHMVVTEGTGRRAQLDYTYTAGKTGTSSGYRDAWFMGFSGQYVTGVWIGNDDFRPMNNVTGGTIPTMAWHSFMSVAHTSMDIPQIPGLPLHPTQIAERQKIEEARRQQMAQRDTTSTPLASAATAADTQRRSHSLMSDQAREALRRVSAALRSAAGLPPDPQTAPTEQQQRPQEQQRQPQPVGNRRADTTGTSVYTPTAGDLPATQGQNSRTKR
jgi:penicillin-binding protein 1A